tara:strand:+ start:653 stop:868 length:216 start_codon:yes stop_codon:yes gene_type:complete
MQTSETLNEMHLSNEAMGTLMLCLQKSLLEQSDIVPMLQGLKFVSSEGELVVTNPPIVKFGVESVEESSDA